MARPLVVPDEMRLASLPLVLSLIATSIACGAEAEDGIFDPSGGESAPGDGNDPTGSGATSEDEPSTGDPTAADGGSTSDAGDTTGGTDAADESTGIGDQGSCPDAVGPGVYTCPDGSTFSSGDGWARCMYEDVPLPAAGSLSAYCQYLDDGYLGFSWSLVDVPVHECPPEARYAPSGQTAYCLWEDIGLPSAQAEDDCAGLIATGDFGFRWPCPPA